MYYILCDPKFGKRYLSTIDEYDAFSSFTELKIAKGYESKDQALADIKNGLNNNRPWAENARVLDIHPLNVQYNSIERYSDLQSMHSITAK